MSTTNNNTQPQVEYKCLIKDVDTYKTIKNNDIVSLGNTIPSIQEFEDNCINNINDLLFSPDGKTRLIDKLSNNFTVITYLNDERQYKVRCTINPKPSIVKPIRGIDTSMFIKINKIELLTTGTGIVKAVVSFDNGNTWNTFNLNKWEPVSLDAGDLKDRGITKEILSIIPSELWDIAIENSSLRIAYFLENIEQTDNIAIDSLRLTVNLLGGVKKAVHGLDYDYMYTSNRLLTVKLLTDGSYKVIYDDPNE